MGRCSVSFEDTLRAIVREELQAARPTPPADAEQLYTLDQAVTLSGTSKKTLTRLEKEGSLRVYGGGRLARYSMADVRRALDEHHKKSLGTAATVTSLLAKRKRA